MPWPVHPNGLLGGSGSDNDTYQISRSLRFNSADGAYLTYTPAVDGDRSTWTWSGWIKRTNIGSAINYILYGTGAAATAFVFTATDNLYFYNLAGIVYPVTLLTNQVFRDTSSWYHIVLVYDAGNSTASNRQRIYVNGQRITSFSTEAYTTDPAYGINRAAYPMTLGVSGGYFDGYMAEVNFIDGQALTPSSFGETDAITGRWKAKAYSGTYGTNGSYLKFADNSGTTATTLGKDSSGNGKNWTPTNFSVTAGVGNDSLVDSPTNYGGDTGVGGEVRGNYATWNPIVHAAVIAGSGIATLSNGCLDLSASAGSQKGCWSSISIKNKTYSEFLATSSGAIQSYWIGVQLINPPYTTYAYASSGEYYNGSSWSSYGSTFTTNDIIGIKIDPISGTINFSKNNTFLGEKSIGISEYVFSCALYNASTTSGLTANFGQRPFAYTAPTGFKALCTTNLTTPTIKKPSSYFDAVTYTGNATGQTISSLGFSPNLVWLKSRINSTYNYLFDTVRGINTFLFSNTTTQDTITTSLTSFNSNGFTLGADPAPDTSTGFNASGSTQIAWAWDEATIAGLDIVGYQGDGSAGKTVSHNLGVAPKLMIVKNRTTSGFDWVIYHASMNATPQGGYMNLNGTLAYTPNTGIWNNTAPGSSSFTLGTNTAVNKNGDNHIAYLFSEVDGFSKIGSYSGNSSTDGPFVWCGFRPKYILIKTTGINYNWWIVDTTRSTYNPANNVQFTDLATTDYTTAGVEIDFLSNGFKIRNTNAGDNATGSTYIFVAFAESPFKYARAR